MSDRPSLRERTFVLIKPEAVQRGLIGTFVARLERAGLEIEHLLVTQPTEELVLRHYSATDDWLASAGAKTLDNFRAYGVVPQERLGTDDPVRIGRIVRSWLAEQLGSGKVVAMVVVGMHAIQTVRKLIGPTVPLLAPPGTIRGDFSSDSPYYSTSELRPVCNLIHASDSTSEAEREIALWFPGK